MIPPSSVHAIVLAAGLGSRMPPLASEDTPKALLTVANRPMLFYTLFSLAKASLTSVTLIIPSSHHDRFHHYVHNVFPVDPLVRTLSLPALSVKLQSRVEDSGTADIAAYIPDAVYDVLLLSCDTISDVNLVDVIASHRRSRASCTVTLPARTSAAETAASSDAVAKSGGKKAKKSQPAKSKGSDVTPPEIYATLTRDNRLLSLLHPADITDAKISVSGFNIQRYQSLSVRSDLVDPHIYVFHAKALVHVLSHCPAISSAKYDLVPYLARRQHTLSRVADRSKWTLPTEHLVVLGYLPARGFAVRANTAEAFREVNLDVATGRLEKWLSPSSPAQTDGPKKKNKKDAKLRPSDVFHSAGERVSVTPDSLIGERVSAGERTSVKKSILGDGASLGSNVKLNGCVILSDVVVEDGANLTACVVCPGAVVKKGCVLKDCRVASAASVDEETEASDMDFNKDGDAGALSLGNELADVMEFC